MNDRRQNVKDEHVELVVSAGERVSDAAERLLAVAPAFMIFNGTRVNAYDFDSVDTIVEHRSSS